MSDISIISAILDLVLPSLQALKVSRPIQFHRQSRRVLPISDLQLVTSSRGYMVDVK